MGSFVRLVIAGIALAGACTPTTPPAVEPPPEEKKAVVTHAPGSDAPPSIVIASVQGLPGAPQDGVTVDGWGPVRIGMTLEQLNAALGSHSSLEANEDYAEYQCAYLDLKGLPEGMSVMFSDGVVVRVDVDDPGVATYGGVQVGDTSQRAREIYGASLNAQPHYYTGRPAEYLTLWTAGGPIPSHDGPLSPAEIEASQAARGVRFETTLEGVIERFYAGSGAIEMVEGCL